MISYLLRMEKATLRVLNPTSCLNSQALHCVQQSDSNIVNGILGQVHYSLVPIVYAQSILESKQVQVWVAVDFFPKTAQ